MQTQLKIAIGCDLAGYDLKVQIVERLKKGGYQVFDMGCESSQSGDYPEAAKAVATQIKSGTADRGIVICGTGNGIAMASNKIKGIRCALCSDVFPTLLAREHNNANVLAMGAWLVDLEKAMQIIEVFMFGRYYGAAAHQKRIDTMHSFEQEAE